MKAYSVRVCVRTCVRASVSTACCICLHQPHNHISPQLHQSGSTISSSPGISLFAFGRVKAMKVLLLHFVHRTDVWGRLKQTCVFVWDLRRVNTWLHPRTDGGLSRGQMPLAELVSLSRSTDDKMHFASLQSRYDQNPSVVFSVALFFSWKRSFGFLFL